MTEEKKVNLGNMGSEKNLADATNEEATKATKVKNEATPKKKEVEEDKTAEELQKLKNDLLLALAETENLRKRHVREKEELAKFASAGALSELSVPFEHLFTALKLQVPQNLQEDAFVKSMFEGVTMVQKEFERVFAKLGLKRIFPEGEEFNPNLHQAVSQSEPADGVKPGTVTAVVAAGFELNGRLLKPAMVVVSK